MCGGTGGSLDDRSPSLRLTITVAGQHSSLPLHPSPSPSFTWYFVLHSWLGCFVFSSFLALSRFRRPQSVTITMVDQYLGGLPVHCWAEVMREAKLSSRAYEDKLSPTEFARTMEASSGLRLWLGSGLG